MKACTRRAAGVLLAPLLVSLPTKPSWAEDDIAAKITDRTRISIAIGQQEAADVTIGLYGNAAPASTRLFRDLCRGTTIDGGARGSPPLSYRSSIATRVEPDKAIVLGRLSAGSGQTIERTIDSTGNVRSNLVNLADAYANSDANSLVHDRAGLVSMKKGGGAFEFVITPAANRALDETNVVIGEVVNGLEVVKNMNSVPVRRPANEDEVGSIIWALGAYDESRYLAVAKAGGDPRARIEQAYKPLQKIRITDCSVLSK